MSNSDGENLAGGCGCLLLFLFAAAVHFQIDIGQLFNSIGNIIKVILGLGGVLLALWIIGAIFPDPQTDQFDEKKKVKRKEMPKKPDRIIYSDNSARSQSRSQERRVSRLEVPGGYVPFEMTRTETRTKDTVKTETKVKTYIDAKEVKAVLRGGGRRLLDDGE